MFTRGKIRKEEDRLKPFGGGKFPCMEKAWLEKLDSLVFILHLFIAKREETRWTGIAFLLKKDNGEF